jgi:hypothetical protein
MEIANVRDGPAKGTNAELKENVQHFARRTQPTLNRWLGCGNNRSVVSFAAVAVH